MERTFRWARRCRCTAALFMAFFWRSAECTSAKPALLAGVISFWAAGLSEAGDASQLELKDMLTDDFVHTHYTFNLERANMKRQGVGEFWLAFDHKGDGMPHIRLKGAAHSPRFGDGEITIVVDPKNKVLHALFALGELHEAQCVTYPFPKVSDPGNSRRIELMTWRKDQIQDWIKKEAAELGKNSHLLAVQWTKDSVLEFDLTNHGKVVQGLRFRKGKRTTKYVELQDLPDSSVGGLFEPPAPNCYRKDDVRHPMAHLELKPPHQQSSALNDLLLVLSGHPATGGTWPRLFLVLSALAVPGDVAVMIEDPEPPNPGKVGAIAFDYTATVISHGLKHKSEGSIWLNPAERSFRLRGEAKKTKVGPLFMDLIAQGGSEAKVYANVNLTVQEEQQCVMYPYPTKSSNSSTELRAIAAQGLSFYAIDELNGEDCGIFVAPLARGHWVHVWVDMESDNPDAILRSEMHVGGKVIRSTDIRNWRTNQEVLNYLKPAAEWKCSSNPAAGQLAHLGLHEVHKRSLELRDALYAVHALDGNFAALELLGLTGDVAIMVQEPDVPDLWKNDAVEFKFSSIANQVGSDVKVQEQVGDFSSMKSTGRIRMTASDAGTTVSIAFDQGMLAVLVEQDGREPQCLQLPQKVPGVLSQPAAVAAIFDGVEAMGNTVCNHFTFLGTGSMNHPDSVEFWYSQEEEAICRMSVTAPPSQAGASATSNVVTIDVLTHRDDGLRDSALRAKFKENPKQVHCPVATGDSWLALSSKAPAETLPQATALAKLAEAAGAVGLMSRQTADVLSQLVVMPPSSSVPTSKPITSIFDPELKAFSFSYTSQFPLQSDGHTGADSLGASRAVHRHRGSGELRVDLVNRRLYYKGTAANVSAGLPEVESRVIFRGDRHRMYVYTRAGDFEQCWSINSADAVPAPAGGRQANPFSRGTKASDRKWVPGEHGALSDRYVFDLESLQKRVQLFVNSASALTAINVDDLHDSVSVGVLVHAWNTDEIEESVFDPSSYTKCDAPSFDEEAEGLAQWEIIRIFFPGDAHGGEQEQRRLFSV